MKAQTTVPFVDSSIIPDRNAGIASLLWDLQNPQDPDRDGPSILGPDFAFIDVGVSRAKVATTLKTLLVRDLGMNVHYVATERPESVPYASITLLGDSAEKVRRHLSRMSPSKETTYEVTDWHFVVNREGQVSSVAYSYQLYGNEVWEAYFMGRTFLLSGEEVQFSDLKLDEILATDVQKIESMIDLEMKRDGDPSQSQLSWNGYRIEKNPLQSGLAELGITLQITDVPQRIPDRQNVLFLGNIVNHYPKDVRDSELNRIAVNMDEGDIIIIQMDGMETPTIEVLHVKGRGAQKLLERLRWMNSKKLELHKPVRDFGSWQQIDLKPVVVRMVNLLIECIEGKLNQKAHRVLVHQYISHGFLTFFRALPVEETLRLAIREAVRRLPSEAGSKGIPVFKDDEKDVYGGALMLDAAAIVSETDLIKMKMVAANVERTQTSETNLTQSWN